MSGQSTVLDSGSGGTGYAYTAANTSKVLIASFTIPAGFVADGEVWRIQALSRNNGVLAGVNDTHTLGVGGSTIDANGIYSANYYNKLLANLTRFGNKVSTINLDRIGNTNSPLVNIDFSSAQTVSFFVQAAAANNTSLLLNWHMERIA